MLSELATRDWKQVQVFISLSQTRFSALLRIAHHSNDRCLLCGSADACSEKQGDNRTLHLCNNGVTDTLACACGSTTDPEVRMPFHHVTFGMELPVLTVSAIT